jgi:hypothetical protein
VSIIPGKSTTNITPAVLTAAHPSWCDTAACAATPDWDRDGLGFVAHHLTLLDAAALFVEIAQGETISPQGAVLEQDPILVRVEGASRGRELTADQAAQLASAISRAAAAIAGGAR